MRNLVFLPVLIGFFPTAHATRPRMNSLGQDPNQGSFYFMDNRNFFRNAANAAKMRNFMVAELATTDIVSNIEGGYFGEFNSNVAYGVYLGKPLKNLTSEVAAVITRDPDDGPAYPQFLGPYDANPVDIFVAGGSDLKWGLGVNYANTSRDTSAGKDEYNSIGVGVGVEASSGLQVYLNYPIQMKSELAQVATGTSHEFNENKATGFQAGIIYPFGDNYTVFGQYDVLDSKFTGPEDVWEIKGQSIIIGLGKIYEISPTVRFNFDLSFVTSKGEDEDPDGLDITKTILPLNIGVEANATDWLTLRAFVKQNIFIADYKVKEKGTYNYSTDKPLDVQNALVAIGGTFDFGKLKIDGNLGGLGGSSDSSFFDSSNFYVNAAVTYKF